MSDYETSSGSYPVDGTNKTAYIYISKDQFVEYQKAFTLLSEVIILTNQKKYNLVVTDCLQQARDNFKRSYNENFEEFDFCMSDFLRQYTATGMYMRAYNECLKSLDKIRQYKQYIEYIQEDLLSQTHYGINYRFHWYKRASLIAHSHLKQTELATDLCLQALNDPHVRGGNRFEIFKRLTKLLPKDKLPEDLVTEYSIVDYPEVTIEASIRNIENDSAAKNFFFIESENGEVEMMPVEDIVIRHYNQLGFTKGIHCESQVYLTCFGLLFWDIIYDSTIEDSFRFPNQLHPLDMNHERFYAARQKLIDKRLVEICKFDEDQLVKELTDSWNKNKDKLSFFTLKEDHFDSLIVS